MATLLPNDKHFWQLLTEEEQTAIEKAARNNMIISLPNYPKTWGTNAKGRIIALEIRNNTITVKVPPNAIINKREYTIPIRSLFYNRNEPSRDDNQFYKLYPISIPAGEAGEALGGGYRKTKSLHKKSNKPKKNRTRRRKY
jgi:hypothetical protein